MNNYLAINTAKTSEILLKKGDESFYFLLEDKTLTSSILLPKIDSMLNKAKIDLSELDFFGLVVGPGSFTGLRIGINTIKAFCYSLNKPLLSLTYFDYLAYNKTPPYSILIDGMGGVCYLKNFNEQPMCIKNEDILKFSSTNRLISDFKVDLNEEIFFPSEEGFKGAIENAIKEGGLTTYEKISPLYLRRSQAEREKGEI